MSAGGLSTQRRGDPSGPHVVHMGDVQRESRHKQALEASALLSLSKGSERLLLEGSGSGRAPPEVLTPPLLTIALPIPCPKPDCRGTLSSCNA